LLVVSIDLAEALSPPRSEKIENKPALADLGKKLYEKIDRDIKETVTTFFTKGIVLAVDLIVADLDKYCII
jgi:hypothetical protein